MAKAIVHTAAGRKFKESLDEWLQNVRLCSEAVYRLNSTYKKGNKIDFSDFSWPKNKVSALPVKPFHITAPVLQKRLDNLLKELWKNQFIFLESLWEEYLHDLTLELRLADASIFKPFCEKDFMASLVEDVLTDKLTTIDEIKDEAAARFSAGITRKPFKEQWNHLSKLSIGLRKEDDVEIWFKQLDVYFEMRNCIIHRASKVSALLNQKTTYYTEQGRTEIDIWPQHLDFYRSNFLNCLSFIEAKAHSALPQLQS